MLSSNQPGEIVRVPEPVARFSCILRNKPRRRMAIVADRNCSMARLHPAAKLVLHDVAVHTCLRVVGHVRIATSVDKRVGPNADRKPTAIPKITPGTKSGFRDTSQFPRVIALLFWMTLHALEHRDVSQVYWVLEGFVCLVTRFAFPSRQSA